MPRTTKTPKASALKRTAIETLIHELRSQKHPRASLLVEARRTLAARTKNGQQDDAATAELREVFELRLGEAMARRGPKSASLINCQRMYEDDKQGTQAPEQETEGGRTARLADVIERHHPGLAVPFMDCRCEYPAPCRCNAH